MSEPKFLMVFDVESVGLHGEGFAAGYVVIDADGAEVESNLIACPSGRARGSSGGRTWVNVNVPAMRLDYETPVAVRRQFLAAWLHWKERGAVLVADCPWPVEARFLATAIDEAGPVHEWSGPYPLIDVASVRYARGLDPLGTESRTADEEPAHDPLKDARQSARLLIEALAASR